MTFHSILFEKPEDRDDQTTGAPDFFVDLNLDQIVAAITADKEGYNLTPFFHMPLRNVDAVNFRHEVMQDLEHAQLFDSIKAFALSMNSVHALLAELEKLYYEHQKERWFVDAVTIYGEAVNRLVQDLAAARLRSRGMLAFKEYLSQYASSDYFTSLVEEAQRLEAELSSIRYSVFIHGGHVEVHRYLNKPDYSAEIEATFERFQQGAVQAYTFKFSDAPEMNHIEAQILDGVALLHGDTFSKLGNYRANNQDFLDPTLLRGDNYLGRSCCLT